MICLLQMIGVLVSSADELSADGPRPDLAWHLYGVHHQAETGYRPMNSYSGSSPTTVLTLLILRLADPLFAPFGVPFL